MLDDVRRASAGGDVVLVVSQDIATVRTQGITGPVLQVMAPATAVEAVGVPGTPVPCRSVTASSRGSAASEVRTSSRSSRSTPAPAPGLTPGSGERRPSSARRLAKCRSAEASSYDEVSAIV